MPEMKLDVVDAAELAELLQFLSQWLARDPAGPAISGQPMPRPTAWSTSRQVTAAEPTVSVRHGW